MKSLAKHRYARISATKVRLVARMISGKPVSIALDELTFNKRKSATLLRKVLNSAISNAEHNQGADVDDLIISKVCVDEGPTMKRFRARARGRSSKIFKRTSHITVEVAEINE
jgi:large subunit ribosomal protein L22